MTAPDRRAFMATTAAGVATPTALGAKECPTMDWITMSLEARNLAYNNVEHVGLGRGVGNFQKVTKSLGRSLGSEKIGAATGRTPIF